MLHLMIAGRLRWRPRGTRPKSKVDQATFDFPDLGHCSSPKQARASGPRCTSCAAPRSPEHDPGGIDVLRADLPTFAEACGARSTPSNAR